MARTATRRRPLSDIVAEEIRVEMARQRLNQSDLAAMLGESQPWVSRRLGGRTPMTVDDLERFAQVLRTTADELLTGGGGLKRSDPRRAAA